MKKLIIAEKPSVGQTIAKAVGASERHDGYIEGDKFVVSWCVGHLCELAPPEAYNERFAKWIMSDLPIMPGEFELDITKSSKDVFDTLKKLIARSDIDELVCATDAGREGECIFRYVYSLIGRGKPFKRLWTSSLEESAIKAAVNALRPSEDFDNLFAAGYARAKADWLVGINFTRLFSLTYDTQLNVGRVQTPTLALIAERDREIEGFSKQKFSVVTLGKEGYPSFAESERMDNDKANGVCKSVNSVGTATVTELETKRVTEQPPKLYDLTSLQRDANKLFGYSAAQTLEIAQKLYEAKILTYPRTDSRYITSDMRGYYLESLKNLSYEGEPNIDHVTDDSKVSDHTALLLTPHAVWANRDKPETDICELIARRMCVAVSKPFIFDQTTAVLESAGECFSGKGRTVIDIGYKAIDFEDKNKPETKLPSLERGEVVSIEATVVERETKPPKRYTEDTLLSAMENAARKQTDKDVERKGLGTPATRAGIIEGLIKRGYVERNKKQLISTERGRALIDIVPPAVKSPELTAEWENELLQVERGQRQDSEFIDKIQEYVKQSCRAYSKASESSALSKTVGKCPVCGGDVVERKLSYSCTRADCLVIWKTVAEKTVTKAVAQKLLSDGKTEVIKGFKSKKTGKTFDARLKLDGKKVDFEFPDKPTGGFNPSRFINTNRH